MNTNYYLTTAQVASILSITPRWARILANKNKIKRTGRDWMFTQEDIQKLRARNTRRGRVKPLTPEDLNFEGKPKEGER